MNGFTVDVRQRAVHRVARRHGSTPTETRCCVSFRADQLLPQPLGGNSVNVAVALDVLHWRGEAGLDHGAFHFRAHVQGSLRSFNIRDYVPLFIER